MFYSWCFFLSPRDLRAPSADRRETLSYDRNAGVLYNACPKIRGPFPQRNWGPKHAKFGAISENFRFRSRIYPEREKISKTEINVITNDSPRVPWKKSGELWSTNYRERYVSLDPPKLHFRETIFRPLGGGGPSNFNTHYRLTKAW